jgi:paraquat-inducible protein A
LVLPAASTRADDARQPLDAHVACPHCDVLLRAPSLAAGERSFCPRCGTNLFTRRPNMLTRAAACTLAAAILFVLSNLFPFLELQADYRRSDMVLAGSVSGLEAQGYPVLAAAVAVFTLAAPTLVIGGLLYLLLPLLAGVRLPGAALLGRGVQEALRWNMLEVFLMAVLVSLLKLGTLARLTLGTSFWAFVGVILCLTAALATLDQRELWDRLDRARRTEK